MRIVFGAIWQIWLTVLLQDKQTNWKPSWCFGTNIAKLMQKKYVTSPSSKRAHTTSTQGEKQRQKINPETSDEMIKCFDFSR